MEAERESFMREQTYIPSRLTAFTQWNDFLLEDEENLSQRSPAARSVRRRVKSLLIDIYSTLGMEVFALATISAPMSKLYKVDAKTVLPGLRTWWKNTSHPESLACFSRDLVKNFDFMQVIPVSITLASAPDLSNSVPTTGRKRRILEAPTIGTSYMRTIYLYTEWLTKLGQNLYETSSVSGHEVTASCTEGKSLPLLNECITDICKKVYTIPWPRLMIAHP
jgi:hypothetical protein